MVKNYLRYDHEKSFGIIASPYAPVLYDPSGQYIVTPALDRIAIWSIRQNKMIISLHHSDGEHKAYDRYDLPTINITSLQISPDGKRVAAGYQDGRVVIYGQQDNTMRNWELELNSVGHTSAVSILQFSDDSSLLASGGDDNDINMWDVTASAGLYRLRGHKAKVTGLVFLMGGKLLISSSKDMLLKLWELDTQHCIQTLIGTRNEIWAIAKNPQETRLVVGSVDNELHLWSLEPLFDNKADDEEEADGEKQDGEAKQKPLYERDLKFLGKIRRPKDDLGRVWQLKFDKQGDILGCHSDNKTLELYRTRTLEEQRQKYKQQKKLMKKRQQEAEKNQRIPDLDDVKEEEDENKEENQETEMNYAAIEIAPFKDFEASQKIRSFDFHPVEIHKRPESEEEDPTFKLMVSTLRNAVEEYTITYKEKAHNRVTNISRQGHGMPVRCIAFSSDASQLVTTANRECKVWNVESGQCIRSFDGVGYGICCKFLPGNKHVIVGTKQGALQIFDINSGEEHRSEPQAHTGAVWSVIISPDKKGVISASSDTTVKFWEFELTKGSEAQNQVLGLKLEHTLKMSDQVYAIQVSSRAKFLAVSLLDSTVKIFYLDSLKFFLSLYGHKLPVNALDISSDETLIVTASQDKNIKIWGLDFGDCHKSIFAHEDSITDIKFVYDTHFFLTASKDGSIKYWDADNFECIQIVREKSPHSPLYSLAVSQNQVYNGFRIAVTGHERAVVLYQQTEEQIFPEEEKEKRMEQEYQATLTKSQQFTELSNPNAEAGTSSKRTIETIRDGETLIDAIELLQNEEAEMVLQPNYTPSPLLMGMKVNDYLWYTLKRIRGSEIDVILALLHYRHALYILKKLDLMLNDTNINIELAVKIVLILLRIHYTSITLDGNLYDLVNSLSQQIKKRLHQEKNTIGFNSAALQIVKKRLANEKELLSVDEIVTSHFAQKNKNQEKVKEQRRQQLEEMMQNAPKFVMTKKPSKRYLRDDAFLQGKEAYKTIEKTARWKVQSKRKMDEEQEETAKKYQKIVGSEDGGMDVDE